jgi:hypothetical protein
LLKIAPIIGGALKYYTTADPDKLEKNKAAKPGREQFEREL